MLRASEELTAARYAIADDVRYWGVPTITAALSMSEAPMPVCRFARLGKEPTWSRPLRNSARMWFAEDGQYHGGEFWPPSHESRGIRTRHSPRKDRSERSASAIVVNYHRDRPQSLRGARPLVPAHGSVRMKYVETSQSVNSTSAVRELYLHHRFKCARGTAQPPRV
jgi:hypothetical protein